MATHIIHFGVDLSTRVPVLESAGFQVDICSSIDSLIDILGREQVDAVVVPQDPESNLYSVASITQSRPNTPVIVFAEAPSQLCGANFDLVIPVLTPPREWLAHIASLIAQSKNL
jgi:hypothetical protein